MRPDFEGGMSDQFWLTEEQVEPLRPLVGVSTHRVDP